MMVGVCQFDSMFTDSGTWVRKKFAETPPKPLLTLDYTCDTMDYKRGQSPFEQCQKETNRPQYRGENHPIRMGSHARPLGRKRSPARRRNHFPA